MKFLKKKIKPKRRSGLLPDMLPNLPFVPPAPVLWGCPLPKAPCIA